MAGNNLTKDNADKVKQANIRNLIKKVQAGGILTDRQMEAIDEYTEDVSLSSKGTFAKNQSELADVLGVNRKTIQRWKKDPTFPKTRPDGRYHIREIVDWKEAHGASAGDLHSKESVQVKSLILQNEKLEIQVGILKGEYTPNVDIDQQVSEMVHQAKRELLSLPSSLAPQVVGQSIAEAEKIMKSSIVDALKSLHEHEWNKDGKA
jgi:predicted DNA-binding protein YlxM (UPF0122 family)